MTNDYRKPDKLQLEHEKMQKRVYLKLYLISNGSSNKYKLDE